MNPTLIENDTNPTYDPDVLPSACINPPPNLSDPVVLVRLLKEYAVGMRMEAEAASGIGNQCGCSNPAHLFTQVSKACDAAATKIEASLPKSATTIETPKTDTPSADVPKTEAPKSGKK